MKQIEKHGLYLIGAVLTLALVLAIGELSTRTEVSLNTSDAKNARSEEVGSLTRQLLTQVNELRQIDPERYDAALNKVVATAKSRQSAMQQIAQTDPDSVVKNTIPRGLKNQMPDDIKELVEDEIEATGEIQVVIIEDKNEQNSRYEYHLKNGSSYTKLSGTEFKPGLKTGQQVRVKGTQIQGEISVGSDSSAIQVTADVANDPVSTKKVAAVFFNFRNNTAKSYNVDTVRNAVYGVTSGTVNHFYIENTFNKMGITGNTYDYVTLDADDVNCDYYNWSNMANTAAAAQRGFVRSNYQHVMYFFPSSSCQAKGMYWFGQVNGAYSWHTYNDGAFLRHTAHELGHNFGRHHANRYTCALTQSLDYTKTCNQEYGDPHSIMGSGGVVKHFGSFHKAFSGLSWLGSSNITTVTTSGDYTIAPIEKPTTEPQLIRVRRGASAEYFYLTFKQPFGYDNYSSTDPTVNGIAVHVARDFNSTTQPMLLDSSVAVGETYTDPFYNISINTLSVSPTGATVRITAPTTTTTCTQSLPGLTITPTSQSGLAGTTLSYQMTIRNNSTSVCPTGTFTVVPTLPAGITQTPASFTENLPPGASVTRTFSLTSDPTIAAGNKIITQVGRNSALTSAISASIAYNVTAPATPPPPPPAATISLSPTSFAFTGVSMGATPAAKSMTIANTGTGSLSWTGSTSQAWCQISPVSGTIVAGANSSASISVSPPTNVGTFSCTVTISGTGATNTPQTAQVGYTVEPAPIGNISISPASFTFGATAGGSTPPGQSLTISNSGNASFSWTASTSSSTCQVSPASGTVAAASNGAASVTVSAPVTAGTLTCTITVSANATNSPRTSTVTYNISAAATPPPPPPPPPPAVPTISLSPLTFAFSGISMGTTPAAQTLRIANTGTGSLSWTGSTSQAWCQISPTSGTVAAGSSSNASITVSPPTNVGTFNCTVTISGTGATNTPQTAQVAYTVGPAPTPPPPPPSTSETTPPSVTISSPTSNTRIRGNVNINATASDASGIAAMYIQIDGATVRTCTNATSCSFKWNTNKSSSGNHTIKVIAVDKSPNANRGEATVTVTK